MDVICYFCVDCNSYIMLYYINACTRIIKSSLIALDFNNGASLYVLLEKMEWP